MSAPKPAGWQRTVPFFVIVGVVLPNLLRNRRDLAEMWPRWAPALEDLMLVLAAAALLAAVFAGLHAWRQARGNG